jgi:ribonuclease Z
MSMELTFLGTSAGTPTRRRNVTGLALREGGAWDLFDCGEGTQQQLQRTSLSLARLRRVFISHLHGDHCFGLFGLLGTRAMEGARSALTVYGPAGLESMVRTVLNASDSHLNYEVEFVEVPEQGGRVLETPEGTIDAFPLVHRVTSFAWWMREADRPGAFDVDRATALGVTPGPAFGTLQRGEPVEVDGRVVEPGEVMGAPRPGRSLVIAGDNSDPTGLLGRAPGAQLLVHEATFTEAVVESLGGDRGHSPAGRVGAAAEAAGVDNVILTHFSPRYAYPSKDRGGDGGASDETSIEAIAEEAAASYSGNLFLANDLDTYDLSVDGALTRLHDGQAD